MKSIFTNEGKHGGEATVEAVRLIADHVKAHNCQLHPDTIEVSHPLLLIPVFHYVEFFFGLYDLLEYYTKWFQIHYLYLLSANKLQ